MVTGHSIELKKVYNILDTVTDPEIPVLTILDLGIVRDVKIVSSEKNETSIEVLITPTYSGCPAMDAITFDIKFALIGAGYKNVMVTSVLSPPWTTDWMSEAGKKKLLQYGIAPPKLWSDRDGQTGSICCPHCQSSNTRLVSEFGSTACKALYQCNDCKEPFDYFKCH